MVDIFIKGGFTVHVLVPVVQNLPLPLGEIDRFVQVPLLLAVVVEEPLIYDRLAFQGLMVLPGRHLVYGKAPGSGLGGRYFLWVEGYGYWLRVKCD